MQAVILAAGKSTRTYPLTLTQPKPLLKVANKPILEHNLERLAGVVDEVILVVGYKRELIKKYFGNKFKNIKIKYVEQKEQLGTGHALLQAKKFAEGKFFGDKFFVMMGDDIYAKKDISECMKYQYSVVASKVKDPSNFGIYVIEGNLVKDLIEKPKLFISNLANTGLYLLDKKIFKILEDIKKSARGEYELTDAIKALSQISQVRCIITQGWLPIAYPWDLLKADQIIRGRSSLIGKNTLIKGSVVNSSIGDNCKIDGEIINSIVMDNTKIEDSFIEDSVIGKNVCFQGTIISKKDITKNVNGKGATIKKIGAIIGDNVRAINVNLSAGVMIWPNKNIQNRYLNSDVA